jgi:hypothetical protein
MADARDTELMNDNEFLMEQVRILEEGDFITL